MPGVFILQDFTAYTEVDPENELTVSSDEIVCACPGTDILGEHILNVYKDFGAGGIGNFSYKFAFSVSPKQETDGLILCSICGVTESSLNFYDYSYINNSDGVLIVITMGPWDETPSLQLYGCGSVDNLVIAFNTTYYVLITRSGNAISCKVYSDSSYEILIQELTGTYSDDCRYIILTMPDTYDPRPEAAANGSFRGSVSDLYIYTELNPQVITPIAQPNSSSLTYGTYVKLLCLTPNATIRYTLDGSTPDGTSTIYVSPVAITQNTVLKAIAFKIDYEDSNIGTFTYTVKVSNPEATPTPRYFKDSITVALSCATPGADIYYTTDGSDPDESSTLYSESIEIFSDTTIKAKAYKAGYDPSDIVTFTYTVTIADFTIKAKAFKSNLNQSDIVEFEYTKASLKDPTYQQVVTTIKDIQLVSFNKDTNIAFLEALPNEGYTTGFYLVIQKIVKRLLTDKGSSSFDSTFGSNLCRILGSSELQDDVILKTNLTIILKELVEAINLEFENLEDDDVEITDEMMLSSITVNSLRFDTNTLKWIITLKIATLANEVASIQLGVG